VPGATFFTGQAPRPRRRCDESRHRAIHGERFSNRISAEGSRPPRSFPGGARLSRYLKPRPSGKGPSGDAKRTRRPGFECRFQGSSQRQQTATVNRGSSQGQQSGPDGSDRGSGRFSRKTHRGTVLEISRSDPGLLVRPADGPASSFPRGRSGARNARNTRPRRNNERRPPALAETRLQTAPPWGAG